MRQKVDPPGDYDLHRVKVIRRVARRYPPTQSGDTRVPEGDGLLRDRPSYSAFPFIRFSRRIFRSTIGRWRSLPTRRSALRRLTRAVRFIKGWEALRLGRPLFVPERLMNDLNALLAERACQLRRTLARAKKPRGHIGVPTGAWPSRPRPAYLLSCVSARFSRILPAVSPRFGVVSEPPSVNPPRDAGQRAPKRQEPGLGMFAGRQPK
jgi:hypothetical protein